MKQGVRRVKQGVRRVKQGVRRVKQGVRSRAGVNSKGTGINQFNSKSGIGAELELKDFE